jgi:hypothetical protein
MSKCKTQVLEGAVDSTTTKVLFEYLKHNVEWVESIKSRKNRTNGGFTRLGCSIDLAEHPDILEVIKSTIAKFNKGINYVIQGVYLNWYKDGNMWSPNHTHTGVHSLVISLGATRNFVLGKKTVPVKDGDAVIFGTALHGIPVQSEVTEDRISIAVFLIPIPT